MQAKSVLFAMAGLLAIASCGGEEPLPTTPGPGSEDPGRPWAGMDIYPSSGSVDAVGGKVDFLARIVDPKGYTITGIPIVWSSEDPGIASVDSTGTAVALEAGVARLTASSGLVSGTVEFTIDTVFAASACTGCHGVGLGHHARWTMVSPTSCTACHRGRDAPVHGSSWGAHDVVAGFDLLGAHDTLPCASCHDPVTGVAGSGPVGQAACYDCHAGQYQAQHGGSGYPTDCLACHSVDTWKGATPQNHDGDYFPINTGKHAGKWNSCSTCHVNPNDFAEFSCFNCHEHDQQRMNDKHRDRSGYVYDSQACLTCHPNGRE